MPKPTALLATALILGSGFVQARGELKHRWTFDEPDGTPAAQVRDSAGTAHAMFVNMDDHSRSSDVPRGIDSTRSLAFAGGLDFSNSNSLFLNEPIALANDAEFTLAIWYKGTDPGEPEGVGSALMGRDNNDIYANFAIYKGKAAYVHYAGGWRQLTSTTKIDDDKWHHIAVVHHADQTADIYVDGVREVTRGDAKIDAATMPLRIDGFMRGHNSHYTRGSLDDARIYDNALTGAEIKSMLGEDKQGKQ